MTVFSEECLNAVGVVKSPLAGEPRSSVEEWAMIDPGFHLLREEHGVDSFFAPGSGESFAWDGREYEWLARGSGRTDLGWCMAVDDLFYDREVFECGLVNDGTYEIEQIPLRFSEYVVGRLYGMQFYRGEKFMIKAREGALDRLFSFLRPIAENDMYPDCSKTECFMSGGLVRLYQNRWGVSLDISAERGKRDAVSAALLEVIGDDLESGPTDSEW